MTSQSNSYHPEFELSSTVFYLNHAAVAPWPQRTHAEVAAFARENAEWGASHYPRWLEREKQLRVQLAELLNAPSKDDIALLKNTSEGLSIIAYGIDWAQGDNVVITNQEFPSNRIVWESLTERYGVDVRVADIGNDDPEQAILAQCDSRTRLVSISSVQYASGLKLNTTCLGSELKRQGVLFCVDAIQSVGAYPMDVTKIGCDFLVADGHKWMLGPEGLAVFYCSETARSQLKLCQFGWHMVEHQGDFDRQDWQVARSARRFECGSPNMLGIHALSASVSLLLEQGLDNIETDIASRTQRIIDRIQEWPRATLLSPSDSQRRAGIVTFHIEGANHEALLQLLKQANVICAYRGGGIRFSPHFYTPDWVIDKAFELVQSIGAN